MTNRPVISVLVLLFVFAAAVVALPAPAAMAQSGSNSKKVEKLEPPTPGTAKTDGIVGPMLLGLVIAGAALTANLIPSKRGHQD